MENNSKIYLNIEDWYKDNPDVTVREYREMEIKIKENQDQFLTKAKEKLEGENKFVRDDSYKFPTFLYNISITKTGKSFSYSYITVDDFWGNISILTGSSSGKNTIGRLAKLYEETILDETQLLSEVNDIMKNICNRELNSLKEKLKENKK